MDYSQASTDIGKCISHTINCPYHPKNAQILEACKEIVDILPKLKDAVDVVEKALNGFTELSDKLAEPYRHRLKQYLRKSRQNLAARLMQI